MYSRYPLSRILEERVVFRSLEPCDNRLQGLSQLRGRLEIPEGLVPRKTSPTYARVIVDLLQQAQRARGEVAPLRHVVFVGDTRMNDGQAASNLRAHLPLHGFIGADRLQEQPSVEIESSLMIANRWATIGEFAQWLKSFDVHLDSTTALIVDIDKTAIGARGRNDHVIDAARVEAVRLVIEKTIGGAFDEVSFRAVYDQLNTTVYHPFTEDNQDYLAYISLMAVGEVYPGAEMWEDLNAGTLSSLDAFVQTCDSRQDRMSEGLRDVHREVMANMAQGDPTPFKRFRYQEYLSTVARMNHLPDSASTDELLAQEIVMTREVVDFAEEMIGRGLLTFGLSDKPDESSVPSEELAGRGYVPLHRIPLKLL